MPRRKIPTSTIPPITDFESCQRARPLILKRFGDILGVWESCEDRTCVRARSCRREDASCLHRFMSAMPDTDRREMRHALDNRRAGLDPDAAIARAQARVAAEEAAPEA
jgi:hypothetical protein